MLQVANITLTEYRPGNQHQQTIANIVAALCSYAALMRSDKFAFE